MTDREVDELLWQSFYLSLRVMAVQEGKDVPFSEVGNIVRMVRQIAESETTLEDPTALAAEFPENAEFFLQLATLNIRNNRELAKRIFQGFMIATEVEE